MKTMSATHLDDVRRAAADGQALLKAAEALFEQGFTIAVVAKRLNEPETKIRAISLNLDRKPKGAPVKTTALSSAVLPSHLAIAFTEGFKGQRGRVSLVDLEAHHCRFPVDQQNGGTLYCGDTVREGSRYCAAHHRRCCPGQG